MDVMALVAKEKVTTPISMRTMQRQRSIVLLAVMSPYPTVMIVVTVK
jgi:hypothetical protein